MTRLRSGEELTACLGSSHQTIRARKRPKLDVVLVGGQTFERACPAEEPPCAAVSPDGAWFACLRPGGELFLRARRSDAAPRKIEFEDEALGTTIAFSP